MIVRRKSCFFFTLIINYSFTFVVGKLVSKILVHNYIYTSGMIFE